MGTNAEIKAAELVASFSTTVIDKIKAAFTSTCRHFRVDRRCIVAVCAAVRSRAVIIIIAEGREIWVRGIVLARMLLVVIGGYQGSGLQEE